MKENINEIGPQILNCVWDGLNEATWYTEERKFTLDYVCMIYIYRWKKPEESCGCQYT